MKPEKANTKYCALKGIQPYIFTLSLPTIKKLKNHVKFVASFIYILKSLHEHNNFTHYYSAPPYGDYKCKGS